MVEVSDRLLGYVVDLRTEPLPTSLHDDRDLLVACLAVLSFHATRTGTALVEAQRLLHGEDRVLAASSACMLLAYGPEAASDAGAELSEQSLQVILSAVLHGCTFGWEDHFALVPRQWKLRILGDLSARFLEAGGTAGAGASGSIGQVAFFWWFSACMETRPAAGRGWSRRQPAGGSARTATSSRSFSPGAGARAARASSPSV
jgi:hypothetical protein